MAASLAAGVVIFSCSENSPTKPTTKGSGAQQQAIGGNIHPLAIQIDRPNNGQAPGADLFPDAGVPLNPGATADWVIDSLPNSGTDCLEEDNIASCIQAGVTGADGGVGHWNGVRIVDGVAGGDQDIFTKGGKTTDHTTWEIAPGSVGSAKYDLTQAYLASNQNQVFFGMERRDNNGTTAFDFEFNQKAPGTDDCVDDPNVPCRSIGDVLFSFEAHGSGGSDSGTVTPFVFIWDGDTFVLQGANPDIFSSINNSDTTKGGPWGHVNKGGDWVLGNLDRFTFAEAAAPLSLLPGTNGGCGGSAFVQVRTRSSSTIGSDLKDTTQIFEFVFLGLTTNVQLSPSCAGGFTFSAQASGDNGAVDAGCSWNFGGGLTSNQCSGFLDAGPGTYTGIVQIADPASPNCGSTIDAGQVAVYPPLSVTPVLTATCTNSFTYAASVDGGADPDGTSVSWAFDGGGTVNPSSSSSRTGSVAVGTPNVPYSGVVVATETRGSLTCTATASASATPRAPLRVTLALQPAVLQCPMSTDAVTYAANVSGGSGSYLLTWSKASCPADAGTCEINPSNDLFCATDSVFATVTDNSATPICGSDNSETENYSKVTTLTASDNPSNNP